MEDVAMNGVEKREELIRAVLSSHAVYRQLHAHSLGVACLTIEHTQIIQQKTRDKLKFVNLTLPATHKFACHACLVFSKKHFCREETEPRHEDTAQVMSNFTFLLQRQLRNPMKTVSITVTLPGMTFTWRSNNHKRNLGLDAHAYGKEVLLEGQNWSNSRRELSILHVAPHFML